MTTNEVLAAALVISYLALMAGFVLGAILDRRRRRK